MWSRTGLDSMVQRLEVVVPPAPPLRAETLIVRAVTGDEERRALAIPGVQRALTFLLAQCVHVRDAAHPLGTDAARALSTGERTRLGLALAAASDGGSFVQRVLCPAPECGIEIDLRLAVADLSERPAAPRTGTVRVPVPSDPSLPLCGYATFRLPDGADQEAVEAFASGSRALGRSGGPVLVRLLDRLLLAVSDEQLATEISLWAEEDRRTAWALIRGALGGPNTEVDVTCQECGGVFLHRLSPLGWLRAGDTRVEEQRLAAELALVARMYGWTEEQVAWLPRPVRRAYVGEIEQHRRRGGREELELG